MHIYSAVLIAVIWHSMRLPESNSGHLNLCCKIPLPVSSLLPKPSLLNGRCLEHFKVICSLILTLTVLINCSKYLHLPKPKISRCLSLICAIFAELYYVGLQKVIYENNISAMNCIEQLNRPSFVAGDLLWVVGGHPYIHLLTVLLFHLYCQYICE